MSVGTQIDQDWGAEYKYDPKDFEAFRASMIEPQHPVVTDWFRKRFLPNLTITTPIDIAAFGVATGVLELQMLEALIVGGIPLASVTLSEPNEAQFRGLDSNVASFRSRHPELTIVTKKVTLEDFAPADNTPGRFHLTIGSQVLYYPQDRKGAFQKLSRGLLHPHALSLITLQMPMGKALVNKELVEEHGWPETIELTHMGMIQGYARELGVSYRREVLWASQNMKPVFEDGNETGIRLMRFMTRQEVQNLGAHRIKQVRDAVRHHSYTDGDVVVFPQPVGVMVVYGSAVAG